MTEPIGPFPGPFPVPTTFGVWLHFGPSPR